jgi:type VI protein secretion system component VasK
MNDFEKDLTQAMQRVDAPEGFAARLLERAATGEKQDRRMLVTPRRRWWWSGSGIAVAAGLVAGMFVVQQVHVRHEREQAAVAQQQFETAMRVTDHALDRTRARLERSGIRLQ